MQLHPPPPPSPSPGPGKAAPGGRAALAAPCAGTAAAVMNSQAAQELATTRRAAAADACSMPGVGAVAALPLTLPLTSPPPLGKLLLAGVFSRAQLPERRLRGAPAACKRVSFRFVSFRFVSFRFVSLQPPGVERTFSPPCRSAAFMNHHIRIQSHTDHTDHTESIELS